MPSCTSYNLQGAPEVAVPGSHPVVVNVEPLRTCDQLDRGTHPKAKGGLGGHWRLGGPVAGRGGGTLALLEQAQLGVRVLPARSIDCLVDHLINDR